MRFQVSDALFCVSDPPAVPRRFGEGSGMVRRETRQAEKWLRLDYDIHTGKAVRPRPAMLVTVSEFLTNWGALVKRRK